MGVEGLWVFMTGRFAARCVVPPPSAGVLMVDVGTWICRRITAASSPRGLFLAMETWPADLALAAPGAARCVMCFDARGAPAAKEPTLAGRVRPFDGRPMAPEDVYDWPEDAVEARAREYAGTLSAREAVRTAGRTTLVEDAQVAEPWLAPAAQAPERVETDIEFAPQTFFSVLMSRIRSTGAWGTLKNACYAHIFHGARNQGLFSSVEFHGFPRTPELSLDGRRCFGAGLGVADEAGFTVGDVASVYFGGEPRFEPPGVSGEADAVISEQIRRVPASETVVVVSDDSDILVRLLYFMHARGPAAAPRIFLARHRGAALETWDVCALYAAMAEQAPGGDVGLLCTALLLTGTDFQKRPRGFVPEALYEQAVAAGPTLVDSAQPFDAWGWLRFCSLFGKIEFRDGKRGKSYANTRKRDRYFDGTLRPRVKPEFMPIVRRLHWTYLYFRDGAAPDPLEVRDGASVWGYERVDGAVRFASDVCGFETEARPADIEEHGDGSGALSWACAKRARPSEIKNA
jgi:hypothetical protein